MTHTALLYQDEKTKDAKPTEKKSKAKESAPKKEKPPPAQEGGARALNDTSTALRMNRNGKLTVHSQL